MKFGGGLPHPDPLHAARKRSNHPSRIFRHPDCPNQSSLVVSKAAPIAKNATGNSGVRNLRGKSWLAIGIWVFAAVVLPSCGNGYINNPAPTLISLGCSATNSQTPGSCASIQAQQPSFILYVLGKNFTPSSIIEWNGSPIIAPNSASGTIFDSTNQMHAQVSPAYIQNPGSVSIVVFTSQPGGGTSNPALTLTINPTTSPTPVISSLSPSQTVATLASGPGLTLIINGTGFVSSSTAAINGTNLFTQFQNSTQLLTSIPPSDLLVTGPLPITVINPPPGGGASRSFSLQVVNPAPTISSVSPTTAQAGAGSLALTVTGTGMVTSSVILINGAQQPTIVAGTTSVSTQVSAAALANAAINQVQVFNPGPGGGTSGILTFDVNPTDLLGMPYLVDVAPDGSLANLGICGGLSNCANGPNGTFGLTYFNSGPSISSTGQYVAFASISNNLVANISNAGAEIYLRNTCLATTCSPVTNVISAAPNGAPANGSSSEPSVDSSATHVAFTSTASNLQTAVSVNGTSRQVYWTPVCVGQGSCGTNSSASTLLVSVSADGLSAGNGESYNPVISQDGSYVAFVSLATNLVSNVTPDGVTPQVYIRNTCDGAVRTQGSGCVPTTYLVSSADGITPANAPSSHPAISNDGTYVTFTSTATNLGVSAPNTSGAQEIFVRETCVLSTTDCAGITNLISTPDGITPANGASMDSTISTQGRYIAFASTANNLIAGVGPTEEVYVRDTCTGQTTTSCTPSTTLVSTPDGSTPANGLSEHPTMDQTGQFVAFASKASNLATNIANGVENIYARNTCATIVLSTTITCTPVTVLVSQQAGTNPPPSNGNSLVPAIAGEKAHVVAFLSLGNLSALDTNNLEDMYLGTTTF